MARKKIVLIIPYRGIGDLIFHLPLIRSLYKKYNSKINIITNKVNKAKFLLKYEIGVKKITYVNFDREDLIKNLFLLLKTINSFDPDLSILTASSKRLVVPLLLSNSKKRIYFKKSKVKDLSKYIIEQTKSQLSELEFNYDYSLIMPKKRNYYKNCFISIDSRHEQNNWKKVYYINLIKRIVSIKKIKFLYINFDPSKVHKFYDIINIFKSNKKIIFTHKTHFSQIINLIYNSNYVIGNESGPICIGAALKKKVISIYYPKHTYKSSKTIYNQVKFFNSDTNNSKKIINSIINLLK